jgi:hypothetical protein
LQAGAVFGNAQSSGQISRPLAIPEANVCGIMAVNVGKSCVGGVQVRVGAQVVNTHWVPGLALQMQLHTFKVDVFDEARLFSVEKDAVFAVAEDIAEADIAYSADLGFLLALEHSDSNGLRLTPKTLPEQSGGNGQILEKHIFNVALIPQLQRNATVAAADHAVGNENVPEYILAFTAKFDGGTGGGEGAVGYDNALAGTVLHGRGSVFEDNAVVGTFDMATVNAYILTVIRINTVAIGHAQII